MLHYYGVDVAPGPGNRLINCIAHEEDRPSCSVQTGRNLWNCKACLAAGDSFTIIMLREGLGFREAIEFAEERFGYEREERRSPGRTGFGGRRSPSRGGYRPAAARRGFSRA